MATTTITRTTCDMCSLLDSSEHEATTAATITIGRRTVTVDLCDEHADPLDMTIEALAPPARARRAPVEETAAIRAWARAAGIEISGRGRIPESVRQQYESRPIS